MVFPNHSNTIHATLEGTLLVGYVYRTCILCNQSVKIRSFTLSDFICRCGYQIRERVGSNFKEIDYVMFHILLTLS